MAGNPTLPKGRQGSGAHGNASEKAWPPFQPSRTASNFLPDKTRPLYGNYRAFETHIGHKSLTVKKIIKSLP
jgi:hypothetical protein